MASIAHGGPRRGLISEANRPWWTLIATCMGLLILMLDSTVIGLALPAIQHDLDASAQALQWVVNVYLLMLAILVVTLGRLGDIFGRRKFFVLGLLLFGVGSVICGLASTDVILIGGRIVQGIAGAAMLTLSLAIVSNAFPAE